MLRAMVPPVSKPVRVLFALALALSAERCAPIVGSPSGSPRDRSGETSDRALASASPTASTAPRGPMPRAEGLHCPIAFDDADVILARVGDVILTACDVELADRHDRSEGLSPRTPRAILGALIDETMLAEEARVRGLDRDPAVESHIHDIEADAVVQSEARHEIDGSLPDEAALQAYYDAHRDDFTTSERVHVREIVLATEADAAAVLREAATDSPFDTLVSRSIAPDAARDQGDLGLLPRGGNDRVPAAIADAAFQLTEPQSYAPAPIRIEQMMPVGRHHRLRRETTWHVVQSLGVIPERVAPFSEVREVIRHRLVFTRAQSARLAVRARLVTQLRAANTVRIDDRAVARVRMLRAASSPARDTRRTR